jgi:adenylate cyclase
MTLLETYLGKHAGDRVLKGQIKRGDGENIHAVIWFCDLRESTPLADSMSRDDFLGLLNKFFDCMGGAVLQHGGEVLRFIGDAALAIFPIGNPDISGEEKRRSTRQACEKALTAAIDAQSRMECLNKKRLERSRRPLEFGLALHVGDVTYGNIGTAKRLEFTVIGAAANEAARLEGMCKTLNRPILLSAAFVRAFPGDFVSLGKHELRGVSESKEIFTLASNSH